MSLVRRLLAARRSTLFWSSVVDMVIEFCQEASVLIVVLGILDSAVARDTQPNVPHTPMWEIVLLSCLLGGAFFGVACILKAGQVDEPKEKHKP